MVAFAFFLKLLIFVASKVDFNFFKALRTLKQAIKQSWGSGGSGEGGGGAVSRPMAGC